MTVTADQHIAASTLPPEHLTASTSATVSPVDPMLVVERVLIEDIVNACPATLAMRTTFRPDVETSRKAMNANKMEIALMKLKFANLRTTASRGALMPANLPVARRVLIVWPSNIRLTVSAMTVTSVTKTRSASPVRRSAQLITNVQRCLPARQTH